jgi:limonene-1,2-epoxide hydrolase
MTHPFRAAVEARDPDAAIATLAEDVVFNSPVAFAPFEGRDATAGVLRAVMETFEDFEYTDELEGPDGVHALIFRARVGDKQLQGMDLLRTNADGLIEDFTVMVRPASGLMALGEAMGPKVAGLKAAL